MKKLVFLSLVISLFVAGCSKDETPPIAGFTYSIIGDFSPCNVEFYNSSTGADNYAWQVEGTTMISHDANPVFRFDSPGTYQVTMTAYGDGLTEITKSIVIPAAATKMVVNKVTLTQYPVLTSNGGSWDTFPNSGPDVVIQIVDTNNNGNTALSGRSGEITDATGQNIAITFNPALSLNVINDFYFLMVYDDDGLTDQQMGYVSFNPSAYTVGSSAYPSSFSKTQNGITATFKVSWK